jgi:hypothetical protein
MVRAAAAWQGWYAASIRIKMETRRIVFLMSGNPSLEL